MCKGDRACPYPIVEQDMCAIHLRDASADRSLTGSSMQMMDTLETYDWKAEWGSLSGKKQGDK